MFFSPKTRHHLAGLMLLALAMVACTEAEPPAEAAPQAEPELPALVADLWVVSAQPLADTLRLTGTLRAQDCVAVVPELNRKVAAVLVQPGQLVRQGDTLLLLEHADLDAEAKRLDVLLRRAQDAENRIKALVDQKAATQEALEQAQADRERLQAERARVQVDLQRATLTAPFAGRLGLEPLSPGAYARAGEPLTTLVGSRPPMLEFEVPERQRHLVQPGLAVRFRYQGLGEGLLATVTQTDPRIDPTRRVLRVWARPQATADVLTPGASVEVDLTLNERENALVVPALAILPSTTGPSVFVRTPSGHAERRTIATGWRTPLGAEVTQGLRAGDEVLLNHLMRVKDGQPLEVRRRYQGLSELDTLRLQ